MPQSFLFTDEKNHLNPSTEHPEEEQNTIWSSFPSPENNSLLTLLKRLCIHWSRILCNKIHFIFTFACMSMLNITTRITYFTQQRTLPPSSPSSFTPVVTSSSLQPLEEDLSDSAQSLLLIDHTHQQAIDLPSLHHSTMANILVRQQQIHRSPSISIHPTPSLQKESKLPMTHSVDDRLFLHGSTQLIHFFKRFASEPHMSDYHTQSTNTNGQSSSKFSEVFNLTTPVSPSFAPVIQSENDDIHFEDIFYLNCDKIQPVPNSSIEDVNHENTDNLITASSSPIEINDQVKIPQLNEDVLLDTSPSPSNHDLSCERHFRRRKRRSSLTKNSPTLDDTQSPVDLLDKLDIHSQQQFPEVQENSETNAIDISPDTNSIETKSPEDGAATMNDEQPTSISRYRGRRLRHRFYRHAAAVVPSSPELTLNAPPQFYLPDEALNVETPRIPSSPVTLSPLPSSISPTLTITPSSSTGALKQTNPPGLPKKNVRFADSVGLELAQVQYIRSSDNDESKEFSLLLGSSLLSSSPPSFSKNNLYLSNTSCLEHKPWSFDVALTPNHQMKDVNIPRRFFCLYRQPNSEHPDIYLHEIWKSQIKLEHADIPLKCSSKGEQELLGTLWVTNASFWKHVSVKYTFNRWLNTYEFEGQHRCHSNDFRNIDRFEFTINIPSDVDRIDFVLRYCVNGQEYWDNNEGKNYTLQTESAYTPSTTISLPHDCDFNEMRFY